MLYSLDILWHDRMRFLPGVLAVAFSALLIAVQCGMLLGLFSIMSIPVDHAAREYRPEAGVDLWVGHPDVMSVDLGRPIPAEWITRLDGQPGVERAEVTIQGFADWTTPHDQVARWQEQKQPGRRRGERSSAGGAEVCMVIGTRLSDDAAGIVRELQDQPALRARLSEPGTVVVDRSEMERLGIRGVGHVAAVNGHRVRVVGFVDGVKALGGPFVFCSLETAQVLIHVPAGQVTFLLARCKDPERAKAVARRLADRYDDVRVFTSDELSYRTRMHWLTKTRVGMAMGITAALGLVVGAVITSQTLYGATVASRHEFEVLQQLGIPRWRILLLVLSIALWVGLAGIALAIPAAFALQQFIQAMGWAKMPLPLYVLAPTGGVTLLMALLSGVASLRALRLARPATPH